MCNVKSDEFCATIIQGSGTYGIEATLGTSVPRTNHKMLICSNGAYGLRMSKIATILNINKVDLIYSDSETVRPEDVLKMLKEHPDITHVGCIHSETTAGLLNPIKEIG